MISADWLYLEALIAPLISLEIEIPEPLFRKLQALLDQHPNESINGLIARSIASYLDSDH